MKIAVITLPLVNNYGGIIQAYALVEYLKELGHQPVLVNLQSDGRIKALSKYWVKKYIFAFSERSKNNPKLVKDHKLQIFITNKIVPKTKKIKNSSALYKLFDEENFDACIVGSDQVFSSMGAMNFKGDFSLGFVADEVIKLSYAASFGGNSFRGDKNLIPTHSKNLKRFDGVSVREQSAVGVCEDIFGVASTHVLDPTMMISKRKYLDLCNSENCAESTNNLFCYVLDSTDYKSQIIRSFAESKSMRVKQLTDGNKTGKIISMEEWLRSIIYSEYIITDSFHGIVFSIIFNKPFYCFVNKERGADRFYSLLQKLGLEDRIISNETRVIHDSNIDWDLVNEKLRVLKYRSTSFLTESLSGYKSVE
ncbi:hypothetical protein A9264_15335 [Vibrio sp. UCD-FRSSP16_10]|uniref:polysaccharide pyruvyl transferase family protein n=1 Tax=unclassified Vibrio TaxID=2614977 RepID=UPI00080231C9|nr:MULTISPECIES: polysaccharide pyruvyl transferase family protein [unclassified Vibrio]OBT13676.1 hypothetical protein A9260_14000 [Vibrio sp. UCD-FRSSP16_30]OBT19230.1 hypothetical protein A9264_15335 [Vibrio sp. UCD-FRSSP16_10]